MMGRKITSQEPVSEIEEVVKGKETRTRRMLFGFACLFTGGAVNSFVEHNYQLIDAVVVYAALAFTFLCLSLYAAYKED